MVSSIPIWQQLIVIITCSAVCIGFRRLSSNMKRVLFGEMPCFSQYVSMSFFSGVVLRILK